MSRQHVRDWRTESRSALAAEARGHAASRLLTVVRGVSGSALADLPGGATATLELRDGRAAVAVHSGHGAWFVTSPEAATLSSIELAPLVRRVWIP
ncbi:MAG: hypothetical protein HGA44_07375 [Cellulomonadaceae bacterium]|nr:hypothetical protein [Cellulomonadaceae bacterium]